LVRRDGTPRCSLVNASHDVALWQLRTAAWLESCW